MDEMVLVEIKEVLNDLRQKAHANDLNYLAAILAFVQATIAWDVHNPEGKHLKRLSFAISELTAQFGKENTGGA